MSFLCFCLWVGVSFSSNDEAKNKTYTLLLGVAR